MFLKQEQLKGRRKVIDIGGSSAGGLGGAVSSPTGLRQGPGGGGSPVNKQKEGFSLL